MIEAVFISDLHLHPDDAQITERFNAFIKWAATHTKTVYILGDFFHVWPGDDGLDRWSESIANQLAWLTKQAVTIYFMAGNRDFLLGPHFAERAQINLLTEPTVIELGEERVLLVHGDRYCTEDKSHQWLRRLTRNRIFSRLFLSLPFKIRNRLVNKVRYHSQMSRRKVQTQMNIVPHSMISHMQQLNVSTVIHGHIHKPGLTTHQLYNKHYKQYVLSDWDDTPSILCYNKSKEFKFDQFKEVLK